MPNQGTRDIIAIDASYQTESVHYQPVCPIQGGTDNQKGHMLITFYDLRKDIPLDIKSETLSRGEMRVISLQRSKKRIVQRGQSFYRCALLGSSQEKP